MARAALRLSLLFSPRPTVMLVRKVFAQTGAVTAAALEAGAPEVEVTRDIRYDDHRDALYDRYLPAGPRHSLPIVMWVHGGAFVGGAKEELSGYMKRLAAAGNMVIAPRYSLAPEERHPVQLRQLNAALRHVVGEAGSAGGDATRLLFAGDSAGAMLAAQLALVITKPEYSRLVGLQPAIDPAHLRAAILCCGPFGPDGFEQSSAAGRRFVHAVLWAYSGKRQYAADASFVAAMSVLDQLAPTFPPSLVTVGNADPLQVQSVALADALDASGVPVQRRFYQPDHQPALGHEYQFDLELEESQQFLEDMITYVRVASR